MSFTRRAVSREHRRARPIGWTTSCSNALFAGGDHCNMVAIRTIKDEDAKGPNRDRESLVGEQNWMSYAQWFKPVPKTPAALASS
jgi:hypothetical protein